MKRTAYWIAMLALGIPAAWAQRDLREDGSADPALLTWSDPVRWQAGLAYGRVARMVDLEGAEAKLSGDTYDVALGFSPTPWLLLYGQAGGSEAQLDGLQSEGSASGAGGLLGARANLWQLYEGLQLNAWRVTLGLAAQYAYRTADDDGDGDLQWGEALVMLPLDYHLTFARSFRNVYMVEFHSLGIFIGPAFSKLDGTWTRRGAERDFEGADSFGVVAGGEFWLLENLSFGVRADWFEDTSVQGMVRYRF